METELSTETLNKIMEILKGRSFDKVNSQIGEIYGHFSGILNSWVLLPNSFTVMKVLNYHNILPDEYLLGKNWILFTSPNHFINEDRSNITPLLDKLMGLRQFPLPNMGLTIEYFRSKYLQLWKN